LADCQFAPAQFTADGDAVLLMVVVRLASSFAFLSLPAFDRRLARARDDFSPPSARAKFFFALLPLWDKKARKR